VTLTGRTFSIIGLTVTVVLALLGTASEALIPGGLTSLHAFPFHRLVLGALCLVAITTLVTRRVMLARLAHLNAEICSIGRERGFSQRITARGGGATAALAAEINRMLEALDRSQSDLRASEGRFRTLADAAPVLVWIAGIDGKATYFNRRWDEFTGQVSRDDDPEKWARSVHPDDLLPVRAAFGAVFGRRGPYHGEFRLRNASGDYRWMHATGVPLLAPGGEFRGYIGSCVDITERRAAESMLSESNTLLATAHREAETSSRAKSEFLANMSHEIRTPMTAIMGYAELLLDESATPEQRAAAVHTILRSGRHLMSIINDVLDLSKIEAGRMSTEAVECRPDEVVGEVVAMMSERAAGKGLRLNARWESPIPATIRTDPTRLRQILVNLVGNAVKFTERGGVTVAVRLDRSVPALVFEITDTGIGLAPRQVETLFQPFTQGDSSTTRRYGGSGLGLVISRRLATLLGGDITVRSRPGEGSTFTVTIDPGPLDGVSMLSAPRPLEATGTAPRDGVSAAGLRVLLAEDGPDNQRLIAHVMRRAGAEVEVVENGRAAIDALESARSRGRECDLVLMDVQMPVMDGYAAVSEIRARGFVTPIIALTAHSLPEDRQRCLEAGCDEFLTKPVDRATLVRTCVALARRAQPSASAAK